MCASSVKRLRRRLWRLLNWHGGRTSWLTIGWLPRDVASRKRRISTDISQLSLLNVEGNILLGILAERLTNFMFDNKYTDTSVQKRGVPVVPGCLEHTSISSKVIEDAKRNQSDLTVLWLDLTNTYGTIPRKLEEWTLKSYHVHLIVFHAWRPTVPTPSNLILVGWQKAPIAPSVEGQLTLSMFFPHAEQVWQMGNFSVTNIYIYSVLGRLSLHAHEL